MTSATQGTEIVPISKVVVDKGFNNRRSLGDLTELAASIKSLGLLNPILVRRENGSFHLIAGERRLAATKLAGKKEIEVKVVDQDEKARLESLLVENLQRKEIDPLEEADGYRRLVDMGLKQSDIATKVGRSEAHISKRLALAGLSPAASRLLAAGTIPIDAAIALAKHEPVHQDKAIEHVKKMYRDLGNAAPYQLRELGRRAADEAKKAAMSKKKADLKKKLRDAGLTILSSQNSWSWGEGKNPWPVGGKDSQRNGRGHVAMTPKQHAEFPCHAAAVKGGDMWTEPSVVYLCTDPTSHMSKDEAAKYKKKASDSERDTYAEQQRRRDEARAAVKAAQDERLPAIRERLKADDNLLETLTLESFVRSGDAVSMAYVLGLEVKKGSHAGEVVANYCNASGANLRRAAAAVAICIGEHAISGLVDSHAGGYYFDRADLPQAVAVAEFFEQSHIELADVEKKALEKATKK